MIRTMTQRTLIFFEGRIRMCWARCLFSCGYAALLCVPAVAALPGDPEPWNIETATWMADRRSEIGHKSLVQLPLPGTHQSLAYNLSNIASADAPFDPAAAIEAAFASADCGTFLQDICDAAIDAIDDLLIGLVNTVVSEFSVKWATNQGQSVLRQLQDGIRVLDFRVCKDDQGVLRGCHGTYSIHTLQKDLNDIVTFLGQSPDEFIILQIREASGGSTVASAIEVALSNSLGTLMITDQPAIIQPLDDLWNGAGRIFVINNGGSLDKDNLGYIHDETVTVLGEFLDTPFPEVMEAHVLERLEGRIGEDPSDSSNNQFTDPDRLFIIQTQLTFDNDSITHGGVAEVVAGMNAVDSTLGDFAEWVADEALNLPDADRDNKSIKQVPVGTPSFTLLDGSFRVGMWDQSGDHGVIPIFDAMDRDPSLLANLNVVSVDHYHLIDGFVEAMIALAGDGQPQLTVVDASDTGFLNQTVFFNELPSGQRGTLGAFDHFDRDIVQAWNELDEASGESNFNRNIVGLDITAVPGLPGTSVVAWADGGVNSFGCSDSPDGQVVLTTVYRAGNGALSQAPQVVFEEAVGPPSVTFHNGRLYVAYAIAETPLQDADPILQVHSAPIPSDWSTLSEDDFDENLQFEDVTMPFRMPIVGSCACVFPRAELMTVNGKLLAAWNGAKIELNNRTGGGPFGSPDPAFSDIGSIKWAELPVDGSSPAVNVIVEGEEAFSPILGAVFGTPLGNNAVIGFERRACDSGSSGDTPLFYHINPIAQVVTVVPITPQNMFFASGTLFLGQWEGDLLVVLGGDANTYDDTTGEPIGIQREITSRSGNMIAFTTAVLNQSPTCDAGGPYEVECNGSAPTVSLASASTDPDGDLLTLEWSLNNCSSGSLVDATTSAPTFSFGSLGSCSASCDVDLSVDDGLESDSCSTTVTVTDTTAPSVNCPSDATLECSSLTDTGTSANGSASGSDTCDPSVDVTNQDSTVAGCGTTETITRSWTATDDCGHTDTCNQTISVVDTTPPSIDTAAADSSVECDGAGNTAAVNSWLASNGGAVVSDTCDDSLTWSNSSSGLSDLCGATGAATVTFTATDDCSNASTTSATFTIVDTADPTIACPVNIFRESAVGQCLLEVIYPVAVTASDVCGLNTFSCVDQDNNSVGIAGDNFRVGTTNVTCTATDDCSRTSGCSFDVVVNDPPSIVSVEPSTQMVQYSDKIVPIVVTATDCGPAISLTLEFDSADVPGDLALSSTADSCETNGAGLLECKWTLSNNIQILEPEGDYVIDGIKAVDPTQLNGVTLKSSPAETAIVQVKAENATIDFDSGNPVAVQVATDGSNSGTFDLTVDVRELNPELVTAGGNLPGDIGLAVMSMTLAPIGPGGGAVGTCTPNNNPNPLDYAGVLTVTCSFDNVRVNTYTVKAVLVANASGELFYAGSNEDVVVVFDPSLGFTTGGGHFAWPGTGERTNWGYTMKSNRKRTNIRGSLLMIRHLPDGTKYRIKSNVIYGLAIGDDVNDGPFGWASFAGKCTYLDPTMVDPIGNHEFIAYVEDHNEPGAGYDRIWLQVLDKDGDIIGAASMSEPAAANAETIVAGNIVVPHKSHGGTH